MLAIARSRSRFAPFLLRHRGEWSRCWIGKARRVGIWQTKHRIIPDKTRIMRGFEHGTVCRMDDSNCIEGYGKLRMIARREGRFEQRKQCVAMAKAQTIVSRKTDTSLALYRCYAFCQPQRIEQLGPLAMSHHHDHRALPIARHEVASEQAVNGIAQSRPVLTRIEHFGNAAEVGDCPDGNIGQRNANLAAFARHGAVLNSC